MYAPIVKERFPHLVRYLAAKNEDEMKEYEALNYFPIRCIGIPPGLELMERVLSDLNMDPEEIIAWISGEQNDYLDRQETRALQADLILQQAQG